MLARLVSVAACVLALTMVGATTAQAATRTFVDGPGDVWEVFDIAKTPRVPSREQGDIARTIFTHGGRNVVVRHRFVQLNREGRIDMITRLRTNTGEVRTLELAAGRNHYRGRTFLYIRHTVVKCTISHSIDYAANVAVLRVPRTCLDNPRTLEAKFGVFTFTPHRAFGDNPINHLPSDSLHPYTAPVRAG